jgi:hypothetical protein
MVCPTPASYKLEIAQRRIAELEDALAHERRKCEVLALELRSDVPFLDAKWTTTEDVIKWAGEQAKEAE